MSSTPATVHDLKGQEGRLVHEELEILSHRLGNEIYLVRVREEGVLQGKREGTCSYGRGATCAARTVTHRNADSGWVL